MWNMGKTHSAVAEEKWLLDFECFGDIENLVSLVGFRTGIGNFTTRNYLISHIYISRAIEISKSYFFN